AYLLYVLLYPERFA
ncbi:potassium-transporting ATPase subunit F, partial [Faecalibacterium sp. Marseille-Q0746]|nr:potassium-transporting ATPase subunit F [Faecalibacterium sp. Marseille-Q0746]